MSDPPVIAPPPVLPWWKRAVNAVGGAVTWVVGKVKSAVVAVGQWLCGWNFWVALIVTIVGILCVYFGAVPIGIILFIAGVFSLICGAFH